MEKRVGEVVSMKQERDPCGRRCRKDEWATPPKAQNRSVGARNVYLPVIGLESHIKTATLVRTVYTERKI